MQYTVIEDFNGEINIAIEDGEPAVYDTLEEAQDLASQLQDGKVVPLENCKFNVFYNQNLFQFGEVESLKEFIKTLSPKTYSIIFGVNIGFGIDSEFITL